jgi:pilus assembly protein Flp/PilA
MKTFMKMLRDDSGASAAEYALILAIVGVGIAAAAGALGDAVEDSMDCAAGTISGGTHGDASLCPPEADEEGA